MQENNDASQWEPSEMLRAVANRIDRGELVAHKVVIVAIDTDKEEIVTLSAGTTSILESYGILALAGSAGT